MATSNNTRVVFDADTTGLERSMDAARISVKRLEQDARMAAKTIEETLKHSIDRTNTSLGILEHKLKSAGNTLKGFVGVIVEVGKILLGSIAVGLVLIGTIINEITKLIIGFSQDLIEVVSVIQLFSQSVVAEFIKIRGNIDQIMGQIYEDIKRVLTEISEIIAGVFATIISEVGQGMWVLYNITSEALRDVIENVSAECQILSDIFMQTFGNITEQVKSSMDAMNMEIEEGLAQIVDLFAKKGAELSEGWFGVTSEITDSTIVMCASLVEETENAMSKLNISLEEEEGWLKEWGGRVFDILFETVVGKGFEAIIDSKGKKKVSSASTNELVDLAYEGDMDYRENAAGGIFRRPTFFASPSGMQLVGEAGPEAVLPLERLPNLLGLSDEKYSVANITVQLDSKTIGRVVGKKLSGDVKLRTLMSY